MQPPMLSCMSVLVSTLSQVSRPVGKCCGDAPFCDMQSQALRRQSDLQA